MNSIEFINKLQDINIIYDAIKLIFILYFSYITGVKIINRKELQKRKIIINLIEIFIIFISTFTINYLFDFYYSLLVLIILLSLLNMIQYKKDIVYCILVSIISLGINYVLFFLSVAVSFFIIVLLRIQSDAISLIIILFIYVILVHKAFKIRKIKNGIIFLQQKIENELFNILILNVGIVILCAVIMLQEYKELETYKIGLAFIVFGIMMFITIKKSLEIYYKQTLLIKDLEETKKELENKNKEIEKLEEENLKFSKTSHTLAHKQKVLEYKINKLMETKGKSKTEEKEIKDRVEELSKQLYNKPKETELSKTNIPKIDDIIEYMQSECIKNNIEFELQVVGNIYHMINNLITEEDLETLIADHVKDAIIAINHSKNTNRSILVKLGKIEGCYSLYIYDTGIEFEKETLQNLGKKPVTTHAESGGTGMGFMNTFDTLNKYNASLIINEIDKPSNDNYTKAIIIKFDNKKEFNII